MASETKTFTGVRRSKIDALRSKISTLVSMPETDSGAIEGQGVKGTFDYNESSQTLTLRLDEVPFFIPRTVVWSTIERALAT